MLSQPPPELHIPKYTSSTPVNFLTRPKLTAATFSSDDSLNFRPTSPIVLDTSDFSAQSSYHHYADCGPQSFDSPISPSDMYESNPLSDHYSYSAAQYGAANGPNMTTSRNPRSFIDGSSSPEDMHPSSLPQSSFYHSSDDTYNQSTDTVSKSFPRHSVTENACAPNASHSQNSFMDQRRMSEPAVLGPQNTYVATSATSSATNPDLTQAYGYTQQSNDTPRASAFVPSLHRGASMGNLRPQRTFWGQYSPPRPDYARISREKQQDTHRVYPSDDGFDAPISPLQADFSGGIPFASTGIDHYGPSPPNTGTSTSSAPLLSPTSPTFHHDDLTQSQKDANGKTYAFVALPGNSVKKRPRRRYDEIERLYHCSWPDCTKSYGTLNHLNAHVTMQKHGSKRSPSEFKEMRKQWRKQKKDHDTQQGVREDFAECSSGRYGHDVRHSPSSSYSLQNGHFGSTPMPTMGSGSSGRYPPTLHRSSSDRDNAFSIHGSQVRHHPELEGTPSSWHASSRGSFPDYMTSSLPSNTFPNNSMSNRDMLGHMPARPSSPIMTPGLSRLPPNSTLLTPLPGFEHQEMASAHMKSMYEYDYFDDDGSVRPGSGHRNPSHNGGDEY